MKRCPDCNVGIGEEHEAGCDWESCPKCGWQRLSCGCATNLPAIPWSGRSLLEEAALENEWYCYWDPSGAGIPEQNYGWKTVSKSHPKASLDLNRVSVDCKWDIEKQKWVKK